MNESIQQSGEPVTPRVPFAYYDGNGYWLTVENFGNAGIKLSLVRPSEKGPWWDRVSACMVSAEFSESLCRWLAMTTGSRAMLLPLGFKQVLEAVIEQMEKNKNVAVIPKGDIQVLKEGLCALTNINEELTRAQRALNR